MIELGQKYIFVYDLDKNEKLIIKAIQYFEKALEHEPKNSKVYLGLIQSLMKLETHYLFSDNEIKDDSIYKIEWADKIKKSMDDVQKNIEEYDIKDVDLFLTLANLEECQNDACCEIKQLENKNQISYLQQALEIDPNNPYVLFDLARHHAQCGNIDETESFYLKILENNLGDEIHITTLIELANIYLDTNRKKMANEIFKQAVDIGGMYTTNYQKLYTLLNKKDIQLIAVQYPMRSIEPLELIFKNNNDVILVDNELLFKNLVREEGYEEIFLDRAAGNFGHCSEKGNLLLAENIKSVILENWEELSKHY